MGKLSFEQLKHEMTGLIGFSNYLVHCPTGRVWSKLSNRWLLDDNCKGTGDSGAYLMTKLKSDTGESVAMYLHEIVIYSLMGITKSELKQMNLQIDHIDRNPRNNKAENLRLSTDQGNKRNSKDRYWNKVRLSMEIADRLREEFEQLEGSKVGWYRAKGKELGVSFRSIQNVILGTTYNPENVA